MQIQESPIIGISGYAGSGKDTVADLLEKFYGIKKMGFADPLREMAMAIDPIVHLGVVWGDTTGEYPPELPDGFGVRTVRYSDALEEHGYNEAKFKYPEIRRFLQHLGTDAVRNVLGDSTWTDLAIDRALATLMRPEWSGVSFADVRFRNEAAVVQDQGGVVIRVNRPDVGPASDHISEHDLDGYLYDYIIENDGTLEDLRSRVDVFMEGLRP